MTNIYPPRRNYKSRKQSLRLVYESRIQLFPIDTLRNPSEVPKIQNKLSDIQTPKVSTRNSDKFRPHRHQSACAGIFQFSPNNENPIGMDTTRKIRAAGQKQSYISQTLSSCLTPKYPRPPCTNQYGVHQ